MRRQTKFNVNVVYVRKGARLFPNEIRNRPQPETSEERYNIREALERIAKIDKEVTRLLLKIRLELDNLTPRKPAPKEGEGK